MSTILDGKNTIQLKVWRLNLDLVEKKKKILTCTIYKTEEPNKILYLVHAESIKHWKYNKKF